MTDPLRAETERLLALAPRMPRYSLTVDGQLVWIADDMATHLRALQAEVDRLTAECEAVQALAADAYEAWEYDKTERVGKLLVAMIDPAFRATCRPDLAAMNRERGG